MLYHDGCRFLSAVGHPIDAETEKLGSGQAVLEALIDPIVDRLADIHETVGTKLDEISVRRRIKFRAGPLKMDDDGASQSSRGAGFLMLVRLTCRPDRSTVVTRFPSDRPAPHALPGECRGRVPARRLE
jgi:hypothetical protein